MEIEEKEYDNCKHLFIPTYREIHADACENRRYEYCGCVKCGLNLKNAFEDPKYLSGEDALQYNYLKHNCIKFAYVTPDLDLLRDVKLAHAVYKKISMYYPDIDDETAKTYLSNALYHLEKDVNEERQKSRRYRLGLSYSFNAWKKEDVDGGYK